MKILYVTDAWHGFREAIFEGKNETNGLPSFNLILRELIARGNSVDFVILQNRYKNNQLNIGVNWLSENQFKKIIYVRKNIMYRLLDYIVFLYSLIKVMSNGDYDFIYAQGTTTGLALIPARLFRIPFGQRVYGTFLWDKYVRTRKKSAIYKHLSQILTFKLKKNFLIVTNDGSRGDLVKNLILPKKENYEFYYWVNGVARITISEEKNAFLAKHGITKPFIFYPARFDMWKRHDRVINIIYQLKERGFDIICCFAGVVETHCEPYFDSLNKKITDLGIEDNIKFLGNLNRNDIYAMHKFAFASMALYDVCNFTNVFHEMMAAGAISIIKSDGIVDPHITSGVNGFLVNKDDSEVVNLILELQTSDKKELIRKNAIKTSLDYIKTWDKRIDDEISLIKRHSKKKI